MSNSLDQTLQYDSTAFASMPFVKTAEANTVFPNKFTFLHTGKSTLNSSYRSNIDTVLLKDILRGYDNRVIPRVDDQPIVVRVDFTLVQLHYLDEKKQMLTSSGWFQVEWVDDRLKWNATKYNRSSTVIPSKDLWLPDIGFLNSPSIYHASLIKNEFRCVVYSDGSILWVPGGTYQTFCGIDISNFPFDGQRCYIHLSNWAYNIAEMDLVTSSDEIALSSYNPSAEWKISKTYVSRVEVVYQCCGNVSYPSLYFYIWIERESLYYIVNIITPCIILSLLATFTFRIPPDSGEKISLGITILLSFTVFQLIVAESIPKRSDSIPIISVYISAIIGVMASSIVCAILISQIHHRGEIPVPYKLRRFTFDFVATIVYLKELRDVYGTDNHILDIQENNPNIWSPRLCSRNSLAQLKLVKGSYPIDYELSHGEEVSCECKACYQCCTDNKPQDSTESGKVLSSIDRHLEQIKSALSLYENRCTKSTIREFRIAEWKAVARVYDRFFFVVFIATMLVITTLILRAHQKTEAFTSTNLTDLPHLN
ncbi:neuronal acetylcholine receptor subunit alpha-10-like [Watersipora subatra]|uniref:neuronal acetylcholine receptor subunit alpha-10-like n=1 Tax=Watersipora subatra TaxID=2589382 RepID=UPI00355B4B9C